MSRRQDEARAGVSLRAEGRPDAEVRLILYHWTHSFSSQKVAACSRGLPSGSAPGQLPLHDVWASKSPGAHSELGCIKCTSRSEMILEVSDTGTATQEAPLSSICIWPRGFALEREGGKSAFLQSLDLLSF